VRVDAIVLNGGSSSGKTSIARRLQELLGPTWLTLGIDDLIRALPNGDGYGGTGPSLEFHADGSIEVTEIFRRAEDAWYAGLAAIAGAGTGLVVDEVFLGGRRSQERLAGALSGVRVCWVGVRCDADMAAAREEARGDRLVGMARLQADQVHAGVAYDLVVDTTNATTEECARAIVAAVAEAPAADA
jgi:chloramphenicol 3-O phosphotransferase